MQAASSSSPLPGARKALALLLIINLLNYIDRYVLAAVAPKVQKEFHCSDADLGLLMSVFLISYTVTAPIFGWFGDRASRWTLIGWAVIFWSLISGGTGLATTFGIMLLTRALIGVGEAAYGPAAPSLISDLFPVERRGGVLAWFYMAIPVGSALGYVLGGNMAESFLGWRWAFYVVVLPGVLLGVICRFMPEPPRGAADAVEHRKPKLSDTRVLFSIRSYVLNTLAMTAMTFSLGAIAAFMPKYLYEREGRFTVTAEALAKARTDQKEMNRIPDEVLDRVERLNGRSFNTMESFREALTSDDPAGKVDRYRAAIADVVRDEKSADIGYLAGMFGMITAGAGLLATLAGGYSGDYFRRRGVRGSYFLVSGIGMLLALPFFLAALVMPLPLGWIVIFIGVFLLFFNTGPGNTALANVAPPALRASAFAINIFIIHLLGDVISPFIVGLIADMHSLRLGLMLLAGPIALSGIFWLWGVRYLDKDTELAPTRI